MHDRCMPAETFGDYCARLVEQQRRDLRDAIDDATEKAVQHLVFAAHVYTLRAHARRRDWCTSGRRQKAL